MPVKIRIINPARICPIVLRFKSGIRTKNNAPNPQQISNSNGMLKMILIISIADFFKIVIR